MSTDLNERLAGLSLEKRKLLERKLMEKRAQSRAANQIPRRSGTGPWPVSYAQELLWLLDQINPGANAAYNVPRAIRVNGPLELEIVERALNEVIARHETLRTNIRTIQGKPMQVIAPTAHLKLDVRDLTSLAPVERDAEVQRLLESEARHHFDLATDLMLRGHVFKIAPDDHLLLLVSHHVTSDGWSRGLIYREFVTLYDALRDGRPSPLADLPIQYADFAVWQREALSDEKLTEQLQYWRQQLEGAPALLELPLDRPRPAQQSFRGARKTMLFPKSLLEQLKAVARAENATLFMILLAAFNVLLYRYSGQEDIVVGTPVAGRGRVELEDIIGYFSNTVVLRNRLEGDPTFRELLARVRETSLGAFAHQDTPFEKIVVDLHPQRDLSHTPIFQTMFTVGTVPTSDLKIQGLVLTPLRTDRGSSKFDLTLGLTEGPEALTGSFEYNTDIFEPETIQRMVEHFGTLLHAIARSPAQHISKLPLLTAKEEQQVTVEWNRTSTPYPADRCLHQLFSQQAQRTPGALAVRIADRELTYGELERLSNQLAHLLRANGIKQDSPVGILIDRSEEFPAAVLGTLKAGGVCVPIDPAYPPERIATMLADSSPGVLLTQEKWRDGWPRSGVKAIALDPSWKALSGQPVTEAAAIATPDSLAYILYTSGSTGVPRGVMLPHRGLVNHTVAAIQLYGITPADRMLQFASLGFDIAIEEMFPPWAAGGAVVFRTEETPLSGNAFSRWLEQEGITMMDLPTAFWHQWVTDLKDHQVAVPSCLRMVIVGGEKASSSAYAAWQEVTQGKVRWSNTYGPTEASVIATAIEPARSEGIQIGIPIGRPIANVGIYILDKSLAPVPIGVPGELCIAGAGVARGYLHHEQLTAEKFAEITLASGARRRVYRTGDLARWRPDGNIEFIGRTDFQVKIRGFRVELGEIEAALTQHTGVRECCVIALGQNGEKTLAAYVVHSAEEAPNAAQLREHLRTRLPDYMIPSSFTTLPALPLTPNGKVDKKRLPQPTKGIDRAGEIDYVPPLDPLEIQLTRIWQELLGIERVGVRESFFDLGGHSLLAVRLMDRIEHEFGRTLPLATLFTAATIEKLADAILRQSSAEERSDVLCVQAGKEQRPFFFFHGDLSGGGLYCNSFARYLGAERPFYALQPLGADGSPVPDTMPEMIARYMESIRKIQPTGPYLIGGFCNGGTVALEIAQQMKERGERVERLVLVDTWANNVQYTWLHDCVRSVAGVTKLSTQQQTAWFIRLRDFLARSKKIFRADLLQNYLQRKTQRWGQRLRAVARPGCPVEVEPDPKLWFLRNRSFGADLDRRIENSSHYRRALKTQIPRRYDGEITLICPSEGVPNVRELFRARWSRIAKQGELIFAKGDHLTCITDHLAGLAMIVRERLDAADPIRKADETEPFEVDLRETAVAAR